MSRPRRVGTSLLAFQSHTNEWDGRADGALYYSVRTTGVYCRPSCAARCRLDDSLGSSLTLLWHLPHVPP